MNRRRALRAVRAALQTDKLRQLLDTAPPDIVDKLVHIVSTGQASPAQVAEALVAMDELGDAETAGVIDRPTGLKAMAMLALRQTGRVEAD